MLVFPAALLYHGVIRLTEKKRKYPVVLATDALSETVEIELPAGAKVDELPPALDVTSPFGKYEASWTAADGLLVFKRNIEIPAQTVAANQYADLKKFMDVVANSANGIQSPSFQQRRVKTTVTVRDGETIILAGMIQDKSSRVRDQVPLIGNIPFLGNLFKNKTDTINRTELLIAITPQVIRDDSQVAAIAMEYRDSINFSTRPQRKTPPNHAEDISRLTR